MKKLASEIGFDVLPGDHPIVPIMLGDAALATRMADEARQAPDVREDRIAEVKARIESGELDSDEVRGVIADRLIDQFGI